MLLTRTLACRRPLGVLPKYVNTLCRTYLQSVQPFTRVKEHLSELKRVTPAKPFKKSKKESVIRTKGDTIIEKMQNVTNSMKEYRDSVSNEDDPQVLCDYVASEIEFNRAAIAVATKLREVDSLIHKTSIAKRLAPKKDSTQKPTLQNYVYYNNGLQILNTAIHNQRMLRDFVISKVRGRWQTHQPVWTTFDELAAPPMAYDLELFLAVRIANFTFDTKSIQYMKLGAAHLTKSLMTRCYMPFTQDQEDDGIYVIDDGQIELEMNHDEKTVENSFESCISKYVLRRSDYHNALALEAFYLLGMFHFEVDENEQALFYWLRARYWSDERRVSVDIMPRLQHIIERVDQLCLTVLQAPEALESHN